MPRVAMNGLTYQRFKAPSGGDSPLRIVNPSILYIAPRLLHTPEDPPETTDGDLVDAMFANDQDATGQGFSAISGGVVVVDDGVTVSSGGRLRGGDFKIGTRYHWQEGIIRINQPFLGGMAIGNHYADFPAGVLRVDGFPEPRFNWRQANAAGDAVLTFTFDSVDVPIAPSGSLFAEYFYFRFMKRDGSISLTITSAAGTQSQTIGSVPVPTVSNGALDGEHGIGRPNNGGSFFTLAWFRSNWSDSSATPTVEGTTWADPLLYADTVTALSTGTITNTLLDSGQNDVYWNLPAFLRVFHLPASADPSTLRAKFVASNSPGSGNLDSMFTAEPWYTIPAGQFQLIAIPGGGLQGRYLATLVEYAPSPIVPLNGAMTIIEDAPGPSAFFLSAEWQTTAWPTTPDPVADPVAITLQDEPAANGTLPIMPTISATQDIHAPRIVAEFDGSYKQTFPVQTAKRDVWEVQWLGLTTAERDSLLTFYATQRGGEFAFNWTDQNGDAAVGSFGGPMRVTQQDVNIWSISCTIRERL